MRDQIDALKTRQAISSLRDELHQLLTTQVFGRIDLLERSVDLLRHEVTVRPRLMSVKQLAAYIGRNPQAVYNLVHSGRIPYRKQGKRVFFETEAIDRWIGHAVKRN